jgi:hypothetical protein
MAGRIAGSSEDGGEKPSVPPRRLCNEIQLFDLCDRGKCTHKNGLFCTDADLLARFEAIADDEVRRPATGCISEELEEGEGEDGDGYDDVFEDDDFGDEEQYEEDE